MNTRSKSLENRFNNWQLVPKRRDEKNTFTYHSAIRHLKKNYANPKSGVSFGGISRIYDYYNKVIPIEQMKKFLAMIILIHFM